jgi:GYF domain 2/Domain of unknown function (DUF4190)
MNWYYAKNGHQNGPLPTEDMIDRIAMGEIAQTDLAWCEGMGDWLPVAQIPQLKVEAPVRAEAPPAPVSAADPSPYRAPSAAPAPAAVSPQMMPGQPVSQSLAIGSLVCGILAIVTCCLWPFGIVFIIAAVVLGHVALGKIKADPARFGGGGMAKAGLITGYVGLLFFLISLVLFMMVGSMKPEEIQEKFIQFLPKEQQDEVRKEMEKQKGLAPVEQP